MMQTFVLDRFQGFGDFDPIAGHLLYLVCEEVRCWQEKATAYEVALRVIDESLKPHKKPKVADLRNQIEMAREEISRVRGRWM